MKKHGNCKNMEKFRKPTVRVAYARVLKEKGITVRLDLKMSFNKAFVKYRRLPLGYHTY